MRKKEQRGVTEGVGRYAGALAAQAGRTRTWTGKTERAHKPEDMGVDDDEVERGPVRSAASGFSKPRFLCHCPCLECFQCWDLTTDVEENDEKRLQRLVEKRGALPCWHEAPYQGDLHQQKCSAKIVLDEATSANDPPHKQELALLKAGQARSSFCQTR